MELRQLKYFLTVADARSFVSAANRLFISRQAVSKAVSQLEDELQTELFMRDSSGAFLTPAGILFYERVRGIVLELEQLQSDMRQQGRHFHQRVRLVFAPGTLAAFEAKLAAFSSQQTNFEVSYAEFSEQECLEQLRAHKADLAITGLYVNDVSISSWAVASCTLGLVSAQPQAVFPDANSALGCLEQEQLLQALEQAGLSARYRGYDRERLFDLASDGACSVLLPELMRPHRRPELHWTGLPALAPWRLYCSCLRSTEKNDLYRADIDALILQVFGKHFGPGKETQANERSGAVDTDH